MRIEIENFLGINKAEILIPSQGATLVAGGNGSGKTSALRALAACATRNPIPVSSISGKGLVTKAGSKELVHKGGKSGSATLFMADSDIEYGSTRIAWPTNGTKINSTGGPQASPMACGMINWMALPVPTRLELLTQLMAAMGSCMSTSPTIDDLAAAVPSVPRQMVERAWEIIAKDGWDAAHKKISAKWSETTGAWRVIAGEPYGEKKAETWIPQGWNEDLASASQDELEQAIHKTAQAVIDAVGREAVDQEKIRQLEVEAAKPILDLTHLEKATIEAETPSPVVSGLEKKLHQAAMPSKVITDLIGKKAVAKDKLNAMLEKKKPSHARENPPNLVCPSCNQKLVMEKTAQGGVLALARWESKEEAEEQKQWLDALDNEISLAQGVFDRLSNDLSEAHRKYDAECKKVADDLSAAKEAYHKKAREMRATLENERMAAGRIRYAQQELDQIRHHAEEGPAVTTEELEALKEIAKTARANLKAWETKTKADGEARAAIHLSNLRDATAQEGVRKTKMAEAMDHVHKQLEALCQELTWPTVSMDEDLNLQLEGRAFELLSISEQFRCNVAIQIYFAFHENSPLLLIDGADVLDGPGRFGLVKFAMAREWMATVIGMTARRDYAELIAQKVNCAWWFDNGHAEEIMSTTASEE